MAALKSRSGEPSIDLEATPVTAGEIELSVVDAGVGEAVLLLHGFPDSARLWRRQIPALLEAGFRGDRPRPARLRPFRRARRG